MSAICMTFILFMKQLKSRSSQGYITKKCNYLQIEQIDPEKYDAWIWYTLSNFQ